MSQDWPLVFQNRKKRSREMLRLSKCNNYHQNFLESIYIEYNMKAETTQTGVANFVQKAFEIISNNQFFKIIQWSGNGKEFTIKDIEQFQETILPKYFRHRNINSFIRQLNMYGFHKSRKEPTKNIFSHPFFQKDRPQLLSQVRRKIRQDENETPKKLNFSDQSEEKILIYQKPTAQKEENGFASCTSIAIKSSFCLERQNPSPLKGLISKSVLMDINPENCLNHRDNLLDAIEDQDQDDVISIDDQIKKERERFNNRIRGVTIVKTSNFLEDFEL